MARNLWLPSQTVSWRRAQLASRLGVALMVARAATLLEAIECSEHGGHLAHLGKQLEALLVDALVQDHRRHPPLARLLLQTEHHAFASLPEQLVAKVALVGSGQRHATRAVDRVLAEDGAAVPGAHGTFELPVGEQRAGIRSSLNLAVLVLTCQTPVATPAQPSADFGPRGVGQHSTTLALARV